MKFELYSLDVTNIPVSPLTLDSHTYLILNLHGVKISGYFYSQTLREINCPKSAIHIWHFRGSEFCYFCKYQPSKNAKIHKNQNSEPLNGVGLKKVKLV